MRKELVCTWRCGRCGWRSRSLIWPGAGAYCQVGEEGVFGFARERCEMIEVKPEATGLLDGSSVSGYRADLVDLDEDGVAALLLDAARRRSVW